MMISLVFQPVSKKDWSNFCDYTKEKCKQIQQEKLKVILLTHMKFTSELTFGIELFLF